MFVTAIFHSRLCKAVPSKPLPERFVAMAPKQNQAKASARGGPLVLPGGGAGPAPDRFPHVPDNRVRVPVLRGRDDDEPAPPPVRRRLTGKQVGVGYPPAPAPPAPALAPPAPALAPPAPAPAPPAPGPPAALADLPEDNAPPGVAFQQLREFVTDSPVFDLDYIVAPLLPEHLHLVAKRWTLGGAAGRSNDFPAGLEICSMGPFTLRALVLMVLRSFFFISITIYFASI